MDEPDSPWGFLGGGAILSLLGIFLLARSSTTGEAFLGGAALWVGMVLTIAGAVRLGLPRSLTHGEVSGPRAPRTPW